MDRGGCVNLLSSKKSQITKGHSMGASCCLIEVERWHVGEMAEPVEEGSAHEQPNKERRVAVA